MPPTAQSSLGSRVNEHDIAIAQLTTIVTELHENAKTDRVEAKEMQKAVTLLLERDANRQKSSDRWSDKWGNLVFLLAGNAAMYLLLHFFHF